MNMVSWAIQSQLSFTTFLRMLKKVAYSSLLAKTKTRIIMLTVQDPYNLRLSFEWIESPPITLEGKGNLRITH